MTVFKNTSEDSSTIKVYPLGTNIESPFLGGNSPFHVSSSLYNKPEWNKTVLVTKAGLVAIKTSILDL